MALKNSSKKSSNNTLMMVILGVLLASVMGMFAYIVMNNVGAKKQDSASAETAAKTQPAAQTPVTAQVNGQDRVGMAIGEYKGEIPKVIGLLDSLKGFKEDPSVKP